MLLLGQVRWKPRTDTLCMCVHTHTPMWNFLLRKIIWDHFPHSGLVWRWCEDSLTESRWKGCLLSSKPSAMGHSLCLHPGCSEGSEKERTSKGRQHLRPLAALKPQQPCRLASPGCLPHVSWAPLSSASQTGGSRDGITCRWSPTGATCVSSLIEAVWASMRASGSLGDST